MRNGSLLGAQVSEYCGSSAGRSGGHRICVLGSDGGFRPCTACAAALLGGLISLVVLFAAGQFLLLMIRIEQNTRATAHLLSDRRARREPASVSIHGSWGDG